MDLHTLAELLIGGLSFAGFVILLMIKNNQATVKEDLVAAQNEMREDMDRKHAQNAQAIAVHAGEDAKVFDGISRTLQRMDGSLKENADQNNRIREDIARMSGKLDRAR
jgi:hypothetical protein